MQRYCTHCRLLVNQGELVTDATRLAHMKLCPMKISRALDHQERGKRKSATRVTYKEPSSSDSSDAGRVTKRARRGEDPSASDANEIEVTIEHGVLPLSAPVSGVRSLRSLQEACNRGVACGIQAHVRAQLAARTASLQEDAAKAGAGAAALRATAVWAAAEQAMARCAREWQAWCAEPTPAAAQRVAAAARHLDACMQACACAAAGIEEQRAASGEAQRRLDVLRGRLAKLDALLAHERDALAALGVAVSAAEDAPAPPTAMNYTPGVWRPPTCSKCLKADASPIVHVQDCAAGEAAHGLCLDCLDPFDSLEPPCPVCRRDKAADEDDDFLTRPFVGFGHDDEAVAGLVSSEDDLFGDTS